jgi:hypothetical protein
MNKIILACVVCLCALPTAALASSWSQCIVDARVIRFLSSINDRDKNRPAQLEVLRVRWRDSMDNTRDTCGLSIGSTPDAIVYSHSRKALNKLVAGSRVKLEYYVYSSMTPTGPLQTSTWTLMTDEAFD